MYLARCIWHCLRIWTQLHQICAVYSTFFLKKKVWVKHNKVWSWVVRTYTSEKMGRACKSASDVYICDQVRCYTSCYTLISLYHIAELSNKIHQSALLGLVVYGDSHSYTWKKKQVLLWLAMIRARHFIHESIPRLAKKLWLKELFADLL